jgi:hypothetical protein
MCDTIKLSDEVRAALLSTKTNNTCNNKLRWPRATHQIQTSLENPRPPRYSSAGSEDVINPAGSENMLSERNCVSVRYQDVVAELDLIGCKNSFIVAQISFILPALIYQSTHLNNEYMGFHMTDCSFRDDHETVFLTCESRDRIAYIQLIFPISN